MILSLLIFNIVVTIVFSVVFFLKLKRYRRNFEEEKRSSIKNTVETDFLNIDRIWKFYGADKSIDRFMEFNYKSLYQWGRLPSRIWLIYISVLVERQDFSSAKEVLDKYVSFFGLKDISYYSLVSKFALSNGYCSSDIIKATKLIDYFLNLNREKILCDLLSGKSVAIVGNGPSEIGSGNGKRIDAHDIVVRFNNYRINGFEEDYGAKTDVWVKNSSEEMIRSNLNKKVKFIIYESDFVHYEFLPGYCDAISNDILTAKVINFDYENHKGLRTALDAVPSTGLLTFDVFSKFNVKSISLYGFSYNQKESNGNFSHYYEENDKNDSTWHSLDKETKYLKNILSNKNFSSL